MKVRNGPLEELQGLRSGLQFPSQVHSSHLERLLKKMPHWVIKIKKKKQHTNNFAPVLLITFWD